ncbi:hypothetical protein DIPPA_08697 [Diplonema papillatum]|nr:hypothetical protein DIPPA_08697 [Diplonema papillatum]
MASLGAEERLQRALICEMEAARRGGLAFLTRVMSAAFAENNARTLLVSVERRRRRAIDLQFASLRPRPASPRPHAEHQATQPRPAAPPPPHSAPSAAPPPAAAKVYNPPVQPSHPNPRSRSFPRSYSVEATPSQPQGPRLSSQAPSKQTHSLLLVSRDERIFRNVLREMEHDEVLGLSSFWHSVRRRCEPEEKKPPTAVPPHPLHAAAGPGGAGTVDRATAAGWRLHESAAERTRRGSGPAPEPRPRARSSGRARQSVAPQGPPQPDPAEGASTHSPPPQQQRVGGGGRKGPPPPAASSPGCTAPGDTRGPAAQARPCSEQWTPQAEHTVPCNRDGPPTAASGSEQNPQRSAVASLSMDSSTPETVLCTPDAQGPREERHARSLFSPGDDPCSGSLQINADATPEAPSNPRPCDETQSPVHPGRPGVTGGHGTSLEQQSKRLPPKRVTPSPGSTRRTPDKTRQTRLQTEAHSPGLRQSTPPAATPEKVRPRTASDSLSPPGRSPRCRVRGNGKAQVTSPGPRYDPISPGPDPQQRQKRMPLVPRVAFLNLKPSVGPRSPSKENPPPLDLRVSPPPAARQRSWNTRPDFIKLHNDAAAAAYSLALPLLARNRSLSPPGRAASPATGARRTAQAASHLGGLPCSRSASPGVSHPFKAESRPGGPWDLKQYTGSHAESRSGSPSKPAGSATNAVGISRPGDTSHSGGLPCSRSASPGVSHPFKAESRPAGPWDITKPNLKQYTGSRTESRSVSPSKPASLATNAVGISRPGDTSHQELWPGNFRDVTKPSSSFIGYDGARFESRSVSPSKPAGTAGISRSGDTSHQELWPGNFRDVTKSGSSVIGYDGARIESRSVSPAKPAGLPSSAFPPRGVLLQHHALHSELESVDLRGTGIHGRGVSPSKPAGAAAGSYPGPPGASRIRSASSGVSRRDAALHPEVSGAPTSYRGVESSGPCPAFVHAWDLPYAGAGARFQPVHPAQTVPRASTARSASAPLAGGAFRHGTRAQAGPALETGRGEDGGRVDLAAQIVAEAVRAARSEHESRGAARAANPFVHRSPRHPSRHVSPARSASPASLFQPPSPPRSQTPAQPFTAHATPRILHFAAEAGSSYFAATPCSPQRRPAGTGLYSGGSAGAPGGATRCTSPDLSQRMPSRAGGGAVPPAESLSFSQPGPKGDGDQASRTQPRADRLQDHMDHIASAGEDSDPEASNQLSTTASNTHSIAERVADDLATCRADGESSSGEPQVSSGRCDNEERDPVNEAGDTRTQLAGVIPSDGGCSAEARVRCNDDPYELLKAKYEVDTALLQQALEDLRERGEHANLDREQQTLIQLVSVCAAAENEFREVIVETEACHRSLLVAAGQPPPPRGKPRRQPSSNAVSLAVFVLIAAIAAYFALSVAN